MTVMEKSILGPVLETRLALEDLNARYAAALDDGEYDAWPSFFTDDGLYRLVPKENQDLGLPIAALHCEGRLMLEDRVTAVKETTMARPRELRRFVTQPRVLSMDGSEIVAQANVLLVETLLDQMTKIVLVGRFLDRITREGERLLFRERICVYDSLHIPNSLVEPV
ncbi:MAG: aromatic-ring-hydroxylating dioxygenase subunit beta [Rhodospirillum sp.]|nr:aromatic-ring-hydroxylating dioxygenase subunit beta [Rhodospirillum sp.]MCF8489479.1 aromatic-ring-hydroxylating dioxygenase subunit beta [Rhodospirillum sp.]